MEIQASKPKEEKLGTCIEPESAPKYTDMLGSNTGISLSDFVFGFVVVKGSVWVLLAVAVLFIGGAVELVALIELFPVVEMKVIEAVELVAMIELFSQLKWRLYLLLTSHCSLVLHKQTWRWDKQMNSFV